MQKIEKVSVVRLWSGWTILLPPACIERNADGSWSAWGADWTIDVTIIDISGDASGNPVTPQTLLDLISDGKKIRGSGWIGSRKTLEEIDNGKAVLRISAELYAQNTLMNCYVSVLTKEREDFADQILSSIAWQSNNIC